MTSTSKYSDVVGAEYRTKTELYAIGVYRTNNSKELSVVSVAPVQQTGPEVAFVRTIPIGHVLRVLAVRKRFMPFDNGIEFDVALDGLNLPPGVKVVIPLYGDMQTTDGLLDPNRFEHVRAPR